MDINEMFARLERQTLTKMQILLTCIRTPKLVQIMLLQESPLFTRSLLHNNMSLRSYMLSNEALSFIVFTEVKYTMKKLLIMFTHTFTQVHRTVAPTGRHMYI